MQVHFIAIGGSAMHNLALALHHKNYRITGSDDQIFEPSKSRLERAGLLPPAMGWFPEKIHAALDAVILGMHARKDNPELAKAEELGLKIYSYPEYLFEQSKDKTRVVIAGSHGKTSITAMILHVLHYHQIEEDYMVGAQLAGFDRMVKLTDTANFMVLEGDEYLSSPIDRRPKFHLYRPNITLISGIAWDHINVFPTFDNYLEQFRRYLDLVEPGGAVVYNETDEVLNNLVNQTKNTVKKFPYRMPEHFIDNGVTYLETSEGAVPLQVFGEHNLLNIEGARWICNQMGVMDEAFYEAIASFPGADNRLQLLASNDFQRVFKDFAHAPSKVQATVNAVKAQFENVPLLACLELHTFSSLNPEFISQYKGAMDAADLAVVFFSKAALEHKKLPPLSVTQVQEAFGDPNLVVINETLELQQLLDRYSNQPNVLLLMSSGNFGGMNVQAAANKFCE